MKWSWPFASKHRMLISLVEQAGLCDIDIAVQEAYIIRARQCTFDVLAKRAIGDGAIYGCTQDMPEETAKTIVFFMDCFSPPVSDAIIKYFIGKGVARYAISAAKSIGRKLSEEEIGALVVSVVGLEKRDEAYNVIAHLRDRYLMEQKMAHKNQKVLEQFLGEKVEVIPFPPKDLKRVQE